MTQEQLKIAIVHDYLNQRGGAEQVVGVLHKMFPEAPIYTLLLDKSKLWPTLRDATIIPSFLGRAQFVNRRFKLFFWLYPIVIKTFNLKGYDIVISSSSAYAKGVRLPKADRPVHICYCYTPMRFAWDFEHYIINETPSALLRGLVRLMVPLLKMWDKRNSRKVDFFVAISNVVKSRILHIYQREAEIVFPPVELTKQRLRFPKGYFLVVSRLVAYKRIDLAVEACEMLGRRLVIIGDGPDRKRLEGLAGHNTTFLGFQTAQVVLKHLSECTALIFPGEEDFGLSPVEAHAQGCPVVAFRGGGALDTVIEQVNGLFFDLPNAQSLASVLPAVDNIDWDATVIRRTAERFARMRFEKHIYQVVEKAVRYKRSRSGQVPNTN